MAGATLDVVVNRGAISFPPHSVGLDSITDVLVRRFAQVYENVHTLCLATPPRKDAIHFYCDWLVGMSEKDSRRVRIGYGRYDWTFQSRPPRLTERLTITIDQMESLAPACLAPVMSWLAGLPHPWCTPRAALAGIPSLAGSQPIRRSLERACA